MINRNRWTPEEEAVLLSTPSRKDAATKLGRTVKACELHCSYLRKKGIEIPHRRKGPAPRTITATTKAFLAKTVAKAREPEFAKLEGMTIEIPIYVKMSDFKKLKILK